MDEVERLREMLRLMTELQADTARRLSWWQDECVRLLEMVRELRVRKENIET